MSFKEFSAAHRESAHGTSSVKPKMSASQAATAMKAAASPRTQPAPAHKS